jgi:serine/threonine-protein kinase
MTWAGLSTTMGTPDYMAPEQVKGLRGDERTDIYSLGAILYEMLTGEVPFPGDNVYAAMRAKMRDDPTSPRRLRPEISPALEEVVLHALERDPRDRFDSALGLRDVLVHLESVVITNRAARLRPKARLPLWLRTLLTIVGGLIVYGLLFFAITRVASLTRR